MIYQAPPPQCWDYKPGRLCLPFFFKVLKKLCVWYLAECVPWSVSGGQRTNSGVSLTYHLFETGCLVFSSLMPGCLPLILSLPPWKSCSVGVLELQMCATACGFMWVLRIKSRTASLHSKCFTHWAISLALPGFLKCMFYKASALPTEPSPRFPINWIWGD